MTQTLTTERQQFEQWWHEEYCHLEGSSEAAFVKHVAWEAMKNARELLANREAQPVGFYTTVSGRKGVIWHNGAPEDDTAIYTAPPAPAVPDKPRLPPHVYRDLLDMLQEAAIAYGGTQQLRAQLSSALSIHVQPDHPHTRAPMLAAAPEGGNG